MENLNTKYIPKTIDECFISEKNKKIINRLIENKSFSNTIFYGGIGYGKTSVINIILKHIENVDIQRLNILLNNDIKKIFLTLERICAINKRQGKRTLFIIEDFHLLKAKLQINFSVFLNKVKDDAIIFIETTNILEIVKQIQNIMTIIKFDCMGKEMYFDFVKSICKKEDMIIDDDVINQMYIMTNCDIRNTLNQITALKYVNKHINCEIFEDVFSIPSSISIHKIIDGIIAGDEESVMNECDKLIKDKFDCNEIMVKLFNEVINENLDEDDKHLILEKLGKQIYKFNKYQESNDKLKSYIKAIMDLF